MNEELDLAISKKVVGEIYPVIKDQYGNILDGKHRKAVDPNWKETVVEVRDELEALLVRVHANIMRREIPIEEKQEWVREARRILQKRGLRGTQKEIADALGVSRQWVAKYDVRDGFARNKKMPQRSNIVNSTIDNTDLEAFLRNYAEALKRMPKSDNDDRIEKFIAFAKRFFEENDVHCPICGEKRLVWRCGHEF